MRIKTILSSATIATVLLTTTCLVPNAFAQKGTVLEPASAWAVTRVDADGANAAYCALARKFKQNTILTIAKNSSEEMSFALDFQKPFFEMGAPVKVVLDPGAGQQRSYNASPASNNAFVVRLGRDDAFLNALQKTGYLRAEVAGQSFGFNLADIDAGQTQLGSCISSAGATASAGGASYSGPDVAALRGQIEALQSENQRLSSILEKGSQSISGSFSADHVRELEAENEKLRVDLAELRSNAFAAAENTGSDTRVERLRSENEKLKFALNSLETSGGGDDVSALRDEIEALKRENEKLQTVVNTATAENVEGAQRGLVLTLAEENRRLQQKIDALGLSGAPVPAKSAEADAALKERVGALEKQNAELRQQIAQAQSQSDAMAQVEERLAALQAENSRLKNTVEQEENAQALVSTLEKQLKDLQARNVELVGQMDAIKKDVVSSYDAQIKQYESENQSLKMALEKQDISADTLENLRKQVETLQEEKASLKKAAVESQNAALAKKQAEVEGLKAQLTEAKASSDDVLALRQQIANLEVERNALYDKAGEKYSKLAEEKQAQVDALKADLDAVRVQSGALETLQRELAKAERERDVYLKTAQTQQQEIADLRKQAADKAGLSALVEHLRGQVAGLTQQKDALLAQADQVNTEEVRKLQGQIAQLELDNQVTKAELLRSSGNAIKLEELRLRNEALEEQLALGAQDKEIMAEFQKRISDLTRENDAIRAEITLALTEQESKAQSVIAELEAQNKVLSEQISAYGAVSEHLALAQAELQVLKEQKESLAQQLFAANNGETGLKYALSEALAKNDELSRVLGENEARLTQLGELSQSFAALESENESLKTAIAAQEIEFRKAEEAYSVAQETIAALYTENEALQAQVVAFEEHIPGQDVYAKLADLEVKHAALTKSLEESVALAFGYEGVIAQKDSEIERIKAEKQELVLALQEHVNTVDTQQYAQMEQEVEALREENAVLKVSIRDLEEQVELAMAAAIQVPAPTMVVAVAEEVKSEMVAPVMQERVREGRGGKAGVLDVANTGLLHKASASSAPADSVVRINRNSSQNAQVSSKPQRNSVVDVAAQEQAQRKQQELASTLEAERREATDALNRKVASKQSIQEQKQEPTRAQQYLREKQEEMRMAQMMSEIAPAAGDEDLRQDIQQEQPVVPESAPVAYDPGLTEAQRHEADLARHLERGTPPAITVRASQDPFADIAVDEDVTRYESVEGRPVDAVLESGSTVPFESFEDSEVGAEIIEVAPAPHAVEERIPVVAQEAEIVEPASVPEAVTSEDIPAAVSSEPAAAAAVQGVEDAYSDFYDTEARAVQEDIAPQPVVHQDVAPRSVEVQSDVVPSPAPEALREVDSVEPVPAPVQTMTVYKPSFNIGDVLTQASIASRAELVHRASGPERVVHQWRDDAVYGSSEQKQLANDAQFEIYVQEYLEKTQKRCEGEFAIVPADTAQNGDMRIDSYDVACISGNVGSSASLLFFNKSGTFTAVAHEAPTDDMDDAMSLRDRLMKVIASGS